MLSDKAEKPKQDIRLLYFGALEENSGSRYRALRAEVEEVAPVFEKIPLYHAPRLLRAVEWRLKNGPCIWKMNRDFVRRTLDFRPDILWIDMGESLYPGSFEKIKKAVNPMLVNTYSDDFLDPVKKSSNYIRSIPFFDCIFAPRDINFSEYRSRGAKRVEKFWKGYNPELHFPETLSQQERERYETDIVFIGHYEPSREEPFYSLVEKVPGMKIWGNGWQKCGLTFPEGVIQYRKAEFHEYRKALCGARIGIQYLTRWNRDTQTSRSFEIPACGVMMLAERSEDHLACFEEDREAVFFSSTEEMIDKAQYYLKHNELREQIARAGYERSLRSGYSNYQRTAEMFETVMEIYHGQ